MKSLPHKLARFRRPASPKGRAFTISRLVERLSAELGRSPTDLELSKLLATSEVSCPRHQNADAGCFVMNGTTLDRALFCAILSRLKSPFEGERDAAALAAVRQLRSHSLTWSDVIPARLPAPPKPQPYAPPWRQTVAQCLRHSDELTAWEANFLGSLNRFPSLSIRQSQTLASIANRVLKGRAT